MINLIEVYNKVNNFGRENGMKLTKVEDGYIEYEMAVQKKHLATPHAAHGGSVAAFMDGVMGVAALTLSSKEDKLVSTVEFKIHFLKPVLMGDRLKGIGEVIQKGKRIIIAKGEIFNQKNQLIATALGTFNSYPYQKSGIPELTGSKNS